MLENWRKKGSSALLLTPPIKVKARASHVNWRTLTSTEDITVIDYLTTLPYVDSGRIGAMGICMG
jgi:dienelactone hydrolase